LSDEREVAVEEGEEAVDVPPAQWSRDPVPKLCVFLKFRVIE